MFALQKKNNSHNMVAIFAAPGYTGARKTLLRGSSIRLEYPLYLLPDLVSSRPELKF
jgi:hypothetical protein